MVVVETAQAHSPSRGRRVAIMQTYTFPYVGYFQLAACVDCFAFLDDVSYIRRGWINRNRILLNGNPHTFSIPVRHAPLGTRINEVEVADPAYFEEKLLPTLRRAYGVAPQFDAVFPWVEAVFLDHGPRIADIAASSVRETMAYLGIPVTFVRSSDLGRMASTGQQRILDLCKRLGADAYRNLGGGTALYSAERFAREGLDLRFAHAVLDGYPQLRSEGFVPGLSILDLLFNVDADKARDHVLRHPLTADLRPGHRPRPVLHAQ